MSPMIFIFGCVALFSALVFAIVCAYKLGKYQGWREALRQVTQHEKASLTLQDGDTLVGVMEMRKGKHFFLGTNTRQNSAWE
jgi:hypothetical protein